MIIGKKPTNEERKKIKAFVDKNIHIYPDYLQQEIQEKIYLGFTNNNDIINQIYCYLNIEDSHLNPYKAYIEIINNRLNVSNKKILEVGSGVIPILGNMLTEEGNNKVTIIDPLTNKKFVKNKTMLINENFDEETNISSYDIIIGYNPCRPTEQIIKKSINEKKDFSVATCGCCFLQKNIQKERRVIGMNI